MKTSRKILAIVLIATLLTSILAIGSYAVKVEVFEDFKYVRTASGVTIVGYLGNDSDVWVPLKIEGIEVTEVADEAFKDNESIVDVNLSKETLIIGGSAFENCINLRSINLPRYTYYIGIDAFRNCPSLDTIYIEGYGHEEIYQNLIISAGNEDFENAKTEWTHYCFLGSSRESFDISIKYKEPLEVGVLYELHEGDVAYWWSDNTDVVTVDPETGTVYTEGRGQATVHCEVVNWLGDVVHYESNNITVEYTFIQWLIKIFLFGWIWY